MISRQDIEKINKYFAETLNYTFNNPQLLIQALTRKSARGIIVPSTAADFENLEFVGDRALNMAVANELFHLNKGAKTNKLQKLYVNFTRNSDELKRNGGPLYRVAKELNLEHFIIKAPEEDLTLNGDRGAATRIKYTIKKTREGHLSDHVEALIGALYIDSDDGNGKGMVQVVTFVKRFWSHMGLNEECVSESSFGNSVTSNITLDTQKQTKLNQTFINTAKLGNWPQALEAYQDGAEIDTTDNEQKTALHHFSAWGNHEAVSKLIRMGAYIEHTDINGWTALLHAAAKGNFKVLGLLLSKGAIANLEVVTNGINISILVLAAGSNNVEIIPYITIDYLYAFTEDQLNFALTRVSGKNKVVLQTQLNKSIQQKSKCTILFTALNELIKDAHNKQKLEAVKDAIIAGADLRTRNHEKNTIFHLIQNLHTRIELLIFILKMKAKLKLDRIILSNVTENLFQVPESKHEDGTSLPTSINTLENISFKHGDLSNLNLQTIENFTNVDLSNTILNGVIFHPRVKFVKTSFKDAQVDDECPTTLYMDKETLINLPEKWRKKATPTLEQQFALKETKVHALFPKVPAVSTSSSKKTAPNSGLKQIKIR